ncbi:unnamed protein product [Lepeophtheirus salmonis]|uniref:(salmon louse) hypothetical protein n=1 Tax=Lepeophtheirus salmonis TaxID=72036 RepID=A0A7R8HAI3_LEPSM|nr:unnamed protein product [Lepeophtheirus salmonis]CAF2971548.1 unnamed protein product [Lepeophtheirus salmonis]
MCPKKEVQLRTKHNFIDPLEKSLGLCVKAYSRSAAGAKETQPCDLRTPDICVKTAEFLINKIIIPQALDNSKYAFVSGSTSLNTTGTCYSKILTMKEPLGSMKYVSNSYFTPDMNYVSPVQPVSSNSILVKIMINCKVA